MKNIHILPTTQKSRLATKDSNGKLEISDKNTFFVNGWGFTPQNIYITSAQEIKVGDWYYLPRTNSVHKCIEDPTELNLEIRLGVAKIIITTDQSLIVDGIQVIDDTFLEWFVQNPSCEEVEVLRCPIEGLCTIIPKEELHSMDDEVECNNCGYLMSLTEDESVYACYNSECTSCYEEYEEEPKQETLEEAAERHVNINVAKYASKLMYKEHFIAGAKWQIDKQERSYSEEEVFNLLMEFSSRDINSSSRTPHSVANWFEQFKKK
jgi:hypothetical protein